MMSARTWRTRLLAGALSTLVVSGLGLVDSIQSAEALAPTTVTRFAGADRFTTARLTAEAAYPGGSTTVVLARADAFPDALAGSYGAGQENAPILLTESGSLHPQALLGLNNLGATDVVVLGSTAAISEGVVDELEAEGFTVTRIGGADRFETAANVAEAYGAGVVGSLGGLGTTAVVASGRNFPDALAAGPISYRADFPLLLTEPGSLPQATEDALTNLAIDHVLLAGGPAAVSDGVQTEIEALGITVDRRFGATRFDTAANLANFARDTLSFPTDDLILATGLNFPDAVAAGPLGGVQGAPIVLTAEPLPAPSAQVCEDNQPTVDELFVMGGTPVVSDAVVDACKGLVEAGPVVENLAGYVWADQPASAAYTPSAAYNFNSEGGSNTVSRSGPGVYTVRFPGLGVNEGSVAVTSYGTAGNECHTSGWIGNGVDLFVGVRCFDPAGLPADTFYSASFQRRAPGNGPAAYVWANDATPAAPYNPSAPYSFNSTGALNSIEQTGTGQYTVTMPGLNTGGGHVQVTAYGSDPHTCKVVEWVPVGLTEQVGVRCFDAAGILVDNQFVMQFVDDTNLLPIGGDSGYVWANQAGTASYDPSADYQFNSSGATNHATRSGVGAYSIELPGVDSTGGNVQVTAYGSGSEECSVEGWNDVAGSEIVDVRCFTSAGAAVDTRFTMSWTA